MKKIVKKSNGFTLTELAIVIAVIAVLIAVLVPTFVSLINSANESADEQNVKNMNTALTAEEVNGEPECLCEVWQILENAGYNPTPTPLSSANEFYWYITANRIVIVSDGAITYPSNYTSVAYTDDETVFMKLDTDTNTASVHSYDYSLGYCTICGEKTAATAVSTAENFATQVAVTGNVALTGDITLTGAVGLIKNDNFNEVTIDLNGYTLSAELTNGTEGTNGFNITYDSAADSPTSITITNGTIYNDTSSPAVNVQNATSVTFINVTFIGTNETFLSRSLKIYFTDDNTACNYTFKSCNFMNSGLEITGKSGYCYEINATFTNCNFISTITSSGSSCIKFANKIYGTAAFNNCSFDVTTTSNAYAINLQQSSTTISGYKITVTLNNVTYNGTSGNGYTPILINKTPALSNDCYELIETGTNSYKNDGVAVDCYGKELN